MEITNKQAMNRTKIFMQNSGHLIDWIIIKIAVNQHKPIIINGVKYNTFGQKKLII